MDFHPTRADKPIEQTTQQHDQANPALDRKLRAPKPLADPERLDPGEFFAVNRHLWRMACAQGINAAIAYLLAAGGTARDMRTTSWSAESMRKRTALPWSQSKIAFGRLLDAGLLHLISGAGKPPKYLLLSLEEVVRSNADSSDGSDKGEPLIDQKRQLSYPMPAVDRDTDPDLIWLPNALINGVAGETIPIELLRQSANAIALRLLIDLYHAQSLADFGGVDWREVQQPFDRRKVGERGSNVVWSFTPATMTISASAPFIEPYLSLEAQKAASDGEPATRLRLEPFHAAFELLFDVGLLEKVGHVIDSGGTDGALVHPYAVENGEESERDLGRAAHRAGLATLSKQKRADAIAQRTRLLVMKKHFQDVQMVGVIRTKLRARTRHTKHWRSVTYGEWLEIHESVEREAFRVEVGLNRHQR